MAGQVRCGVYFKKIRPSSIFLINNDPLYFYKKNYVYHLNHINIYYDIKNVTYNLSKLDQITKLLYIYIIFLIYKNNNKINIIKYVNNNYLNYLYYYFNSNLLNINNYYRTYKKKFF